MACSRSSRIGAAPALRLQRRQRAAQPRIDLAQRVSIAASPAPSSTTRSTSCRLCSSSAL